MNAAYERLIQHLDSHEFRYSANADEHSIIAEFRGEVGHYRILAQVTDEVKLFQVFGSAPVRIPPGAKPAVAETLTRVNCGLRLGKFEMELDEGEFRFQVAQILTDDELDDEVIQRMIQTTLAMLDRYLPAVLAVIYGNEVPKDAVRHAEGGLRPDAGD